MSDKSLKEYISFFIKRKIFILSATVLFLLIGLFVAVVLQKPIYTAEGIVKINSFSFEKDIKNIFGGDNNIGIETSADLPQASIESSIFPSIYPVDVLNLINASEFKNILAKNGCTNASFDTGYDSNSGFIILRSSGTDGQAVNNCLRIAFNKIPIEFSSKLQNQIKKNISTLTKATNNEVKNMLRFKALLKNTKQDTQEYLDFSEDLKLSTFTYEKLKLALKKLEFIENVDAKAKLGISWVREPSAIDANNLNKKVLNVGAITFLGLVLSLLAVLLFELWKKETINLDK